MARPEGQTVNFLSYNSTGLNPVKSKWICDLMKTCNINFCSIQEHFKKTKNLSNYFKAEFRGYESYAVAAYREEGRDTGRAKGGLAQLCCGAEGVRREKVMTGSWRLQA